MIDFISLGYNCQIAQQLQKRDYPVFEHLFSDMVSKNLNGISDLLDAECAEFFNPANLLIDGSWFDEFGADDKYIVRDTLYEINDVHNFSKNVDFDVSLKKFLEKSIPKRVEFIDKIKNSHCPHIFRTNINDETIDGIKRLRDSISKLRNGKSFNLHCFQDSKFMRINWGVPDLHTYWIQSWKWKGSMWTGTYRDKWEGDPELWDELLKRLDIFGSKKIFM